MIKEFREMNVSEELKQGIQALGFEQPTQIQAKAIPEILKNKDVIGQAQTGTGKTAAFAIPTLEQIDTSSNDVQSIVLCPTRELAIQVTKEFEALSKNMDNVNVLSVYGGQSIGGQIKALNRGIQIVVGTPGRTMDHIRRNTLKLDNIKSVILDEADEMLNMGFRDDIEFVLKQTPKQRQTILFSATMPGQIKRIAKKYQKNSQLIKTDQKSLAVKNIEQSYLHVNKKQKYDILLKFLQAKPFELSIIFSNTKKETDKVAKKLSKDGFAVDSLHGDMSQRQRDNVMDKFRKGHIKILTATDVAARGLDVDDIDLVFNYDIPQDPQYYIHRIGRTGRAGRSGEAITFASGRFKKNLRKIKKFNLKKVKPPTKKQIKKAKEDMLVARVKDMISDEDSNENTQVVNRVMQETNQSAADIASALLAKTLKEDNQKEEKDGMLMNQFENSGGEPGMVRLFFNIGKTKRAKPRDFVGAIASEASIPGNSIGAIDVLSDFSFVEVPMEHGEQVIDTMKNNTIKGHDVNVEIANVR